MTGATGKEQNRQYPTRSRYSFWVHDGTLPERKGVSNVNGEIRNSSQRIFLPSKCSQKRLENSLGPAGIAGSRIRFSAPWYPSTDGHAKSRKQYSTASPLQIGLSRDPSLLPSPCPSPFSSRQCGPIHRSRFSGCRQLPIGSAAKKLSEQWGASSRGIERNPFGWPYGSGRGLPRPTDEPPKVLRLHPSWTGALRCCRRLWRCFLASGKVLGPFAVESVPQLGASIVAVIPWVNFHVPAVIGRF